MGRDSEISWTDHTFNPWVGCTKVSDGCKNCYAEMLMDKRYGKVRWGPQGTRVRTSAANWKQPLLWNRQAEAKGRRYRVFCASLADVFEDLPGLVEWRADLLALISNTPSLDWLLLTKRPENINRMVADYAGDCAWLGWHGTTKRTNIWIGTSVENQEQADKRIPHLLRTEAHIKFLSMEPLLGPVDLTIYREIEGFEVALDTLRGVETIDGQGHLPVDRLAWVIAGGESGAGARPMHPDWARSIHQQCAAAGVAFFMKQMGSVWAKENAASAKGGEWSEIPEDIRVREFPRNEHVDF